MVVVSFLCEKIKPDLNFESKQIPLELYNPYHESYVVTAHKLLVCWPCNYKLLFEIGEHIKGRFSHKNLIELSTLSENFKDSIQTFSCAGSCNTVSGKNSPNSSYKHLVRQKIWVNMLLLSGSPILVEDCGDRQNLRYRSNSRSMHQ